MLKNNKILLTSVAALSLGLASVTPLLPSLEVAATTQTVAVQGERLVSLGASLTAEQGQETLRLLGAGQVPQANIIYVDGEMVNRYLKDGSNASTGVYSSLYIEPQVTGSGVQVQITTPQNITVVTPLTYQNAAITAGVKDAVIRVASVNQVTGEGALTGIYALLERIGVQVSPQTAQVAQQEINVISNIQETTQLTNVEVNQIIANIKTEIVNNNINQVELNQEVIQAIVNQAIEQVTTPDQVDDTTKQELADYAEDFTATEAAHDQATSDQLASSIAEDWDQVLTDATVDYQTVDELLQADPITSDNPKIQAMIDQAYQVMQTPSELTPRAVYGHSFIFEDLQADLTGQDHQDLNQLRDLLFQYEVLTQVGGEDPEVTPERIKEEWLRSLRAIEELKLQDSNLAAIYQRVAQATGRALEISSYDPVHEARQAGDLVSVVLYDNMYTHAAARTEYAYSLNEQVVYMVDPATQELVVQPGFDFQAVYGFQIDPLAEQAPVDPAYVLPGSEQSAAESAPLTDEAVSDTNEVASEAAGEGAEGLVTPVEEGGEAVAPAEDPAATTPVESTEAASE